MNRSSLIRILPFLILFGGFALRLVRLGASGLWYDETVSLLLARSELTELVRHTAGDIHPPLYYLLLSGWGRLAGWSEFSAAFLSLWFGVLLMAMVMRAAREWYGVRPISATNQLPPQSTSTAREGLALFQVGVGQFDALGWIAPIAMFLVAISPFNIWYSQEVRMYTLGASLGLASVFFLRRTILAGTRFNLDFFAYVAVTVAGLYTLYYFLFLLVFQWLWAAWRVWHSARGFRSPMVATFLLSQLAVVILYLPWLPIAFRQATDPPVPPWRELVSLPRVLLESSTALVFGQSVEPLQFLPLVILLALLVGFVCLYPARLNSPNSPSPLFLLGYTFIPLASIYLFSLWIPLYHVRYLYPFSPGFYILIAYSLVAVWVWFRGWRGVSDRALARTAAIAAAGLALLFLGVIGYSLANFWNEPKFAKDDLRGAVTYIAERWRPGDVILVNAGYAYPALDYYLPGEMTRERLTEYSPTVESGPAANTPFILQTGSIGGEANLGWGDPLSDFYPTSAEETRSALDRVFMEHPRVWVLRLYDTVVDPEGFIRVYLDEHGILFDDQVYSGESQARVQGYLTRPGEVLPEGATPIARQFGEQVELAGAEIGARELERGGAFDAILYWRLVQAVNHNYRISLQLLDAAGNNVAQSDETPLSDLLPMTRWKTNQLYREPLRLTISPDLAPGSYQAIVKLYNPRSQEVLGQPFQLGTVMVK